MNSDSRRSANTINGSFMALGGFGSATIQIAQSQPPFVLLSGIVSAIGNTEEGQTITAMGPAWKQINEILHRNPQELMSLTPRQWEELIAAAYDREGFTVTLTPRSGDFGRDIIAVRKDRFSLRIIDQVKAFAPDRLVDANDVRAMLGVLSADRNATKAVVTTTSDFAPRIKDDPSIAPFMPYRLELMNGKELFERLKGLGDPTLDE